jgi:hypothetical protein
MEEDTEEIKSSVSCSHISVHPWLIRLRIRRQCGRPAAAATYGRARETVSHEEPRTSGRNG